MAGPARHVLRHAPLMLQQEKEKKKKKKTTTKKMSEGRVSGSPGSQTLAETRRRLLPREQLQLSAASPERMDEHAQPQTKERMG